SSWRSMRLPNTGLPKVSFLPRILPDPFGDFVLFSFPAILTPRAAIALCIDDSVRFSRGVFSGSNSCDMPCLVTMRKQQFSLHASLAKLLAKTDFVPFLQSQATDSRLFGLSDFT